MNAPVVEFLGTALLLSAVAFTGDGLFVIAALAIAIALGGKVSGGHFNPAITVLQLLNGKIQMKKATPYLVAQFAAAAAVYALSMVVGRV